MAVAAEFGKLESGSKESYETLRRRTDVLITIGDVVSYNALVNGVEPDLVIHNAKVGGSVVTVSVLERLSQWTAAEETIVDGKAGVSRESFDLLNGYFSGKQEGKRLRMRVDGGEEDPFIVPCLALAPLGTLILTGERNVGIRVMVVNEQNKDDARKVLNRYFGVRENEMEGLKKLLESDESSAKAFLSVKGYNDEQISEALQRARDELKAERKERKSGKEQQHYDVLNFKMNAVLAFLWRFLNIAGMLVVLLLILAILNHYLLPSMLPLFLKGNGTDDGNAGYANASSVLSVLPVNCNSSSSSAILSIHNKGGSEILGVLNLTIIENNAFCDSLNGSLPAGGVSKEITCTGETPFTKGKTYTVVFSPNGYGKVRFIC